MARIRLFQPWPEPYLRRDGSGGAAGLAELRRDRRDARRRNLPAGGGIGEADLATESDVRVFPSSTAGTSSSLALSIFVFKFVHLATVVLVPGFLGNIQGYRPIETGQALAWVAVPMFAVVWLVALAGDLYELAADPGLGLTIVAVGCWILRTSILRGREAASRSWSSSSRWGSRAPTSAW